MEMDTQVRTNETLEEHKEEIRLQKFYDSEIQPLIRKGDYIKVTKLLSEQPRLEDYLSRVDFRKMYFFFSEEYLKGLEGKTK